VLAIAEEVAAGRASLAGRDQFLIRAVGFHDTDLVALVALSRRLENKALSIRRPVSLAFWPPCVSCRMSARRCGPAPSANALKHRTRSSFILRLKREMFQCLRPKRELRL